MADVDDDSQVNHVEIIVEKPLTYVHLTIPPQYAQLISF